MEENKQGKGKWNTRKVASWNSKYGGYGRLHQMETSEWRFEEAKEASRAGVWGQSFPGWGIIQCKGPRAEACLARPRDTKVAGVSVVVWTRLGKYEIRSEMYRRWKIAVIRWGQWVIYCEWSRKLREYFQQRMWLHLPGFDGISPAAVLKID